MENGHNYAISRNKYNETFMGGFKHCGYFYFKIGGYALFFALDAMNF